MGATVKRTLFRGGLPLLLVLVAACSDSTGPSRPLAVEPGTPVVAIGDTTRIRVTGGASDSDKIQWKSEDPSIATINGSGLVTGVRKGTVSITARSGDAGSTVQVHVVASQYNVQTEHFCDHPDYRNGRVVGVGDHLIIVADTDNPTGGFTDKEYQELAESFDELIYPTVTEHFGEPADIDDNDRVVAFFTRAVNELTPAGSDGYVGGFFYARDLFPKKGSTTMQGCAGSNEAEIFYLIVPDPTGAVNNNRRPKDVVAEIALGTMAHELQHLINSSRRLFVNNADDSAEDLWLNEGLSHIAEELVFYRAAGLGPRQNIGVNQLRSSERLVNAFNLYQSSNFGRLSRFLSATESHAAYGDSASLGNRGAAWLFLRYLADRTGIPERDLWFKLVNSSTSGFTNVQQVIGEDLSPLYRDWSVASYLDDLVTTREPGHQHASWNYRSIMAAVNGSVIEPRQLSPVRQEQLVLQAGGAAYLEFEALPLQRARIQVASGTQTSSPGECSPETPGVALAVGEVYTSARGDLQAICVDGGTSGGEYVLIVTNVARTKTSLPITVTGSGIMAPTATPALVAARSLDLRPTDRTRLASRRRTDHPEGLRRDLAVEHRIRYQEIAEMSARLGSGRRSSARALFQMLPGQPSDLYISVARTR
jgi:hypothetical protein